MVCIPCIVIPFCLWIFHRFIRPILLKFWNPWSGKKVTASCDKSLPSAKKSVELKTKPENEEVKTDKNNQNGIIESKQTFPPDSLINTKTTGENTLQQLQEKCVADKKRD